MIQRGTTKKSHQNRSVGGSIEPRSASYNSLGMGAGKLAFFRFVVLLSCFSLFVTLAPSAQALELTYGGRLALPSGEPVTGPLDLTFRFYRDASGGSALATVPVPSVPLVDGVFQTSLNLSAEDLGRLFEDGDKTVFVEVETQGKVYPRQKFSYVPLALRVPVDGSKIIYDSEGRLTISPGALSSSTSLSGATGTGGVEKVGDQTYSTYALSAAGKALVGAVDLAAQKSILGLGVLDGVTSSIQNQLNNKLSLSGGTMTGALDMGGAHTIVNLADPTASGDATKKSYVDGKLGGQPLVVGTPSPGQVIKWDGSKFALATDEMGVAGGGIANLNGLTSGSQSLAVEIPGVTTGIRPTWAADSGTSTHTLNIPMASGSDVTAGLLSKTEFDQFSGKQSAITPSSALETGSMTTNLQNALEIKPYGTSTAQTGEVRFRELAASGSQYVGLKAPDTLATNTIWTLPTGDGPSGHVLSTNGSGTLSWISPLTAVSGGAGGTIVDGTIGNDDIAPSAAIAQSKVAGLTTDLAAKEPTLPAGTATQYYRGDKTWQTLNTTAVPEGAGLYFTTTRARQSLSVSAPLEYDTSTGVISMGQASGVASGFLTSADFTSFNAKQSAITTSTTVNAGSFTSALQNGYEVKPYGSTAGSTGEIRFAELAANGGNFIGLKAPDVLAGDVVWTLPSTTGTNGQVLSTGSSGVLSWITLPSAPVSSVAGRTGNVTLNTADISGLGSLATASTVSGGTGGTIADDSITNADINSGAAIVDTKLATIVTAGKVANSATTATSAGTANAIVVRDASGNFTAGTITATLNGNATNVTGTVALANGGTGATTAASARNNLGAAASGANTDITSLTNLTSLSTTGNVGIGSATPSFRLDVAASGAGMQTVERLQNTVTAANNSGAQTMYSANRTTNGLTDVAAVGGTITDVSASAYKGALVFSTANNAAPAERMRVDANGNVGIGTSAPRTALDLSSRTDAIALPSGTSGQQPPAPVAGWMRYNSTSNTIEFYNGSIWTAASNAVDPAGMIGAFPMSSCPSGWLEANGAAVSRTTYSSLFTAIGTSYGPGDGSTTFNLPDYRGYFLRGWNHGASNDPDASTRTNRGDSTTGDNVGTKQADQYGTHAHNLGQSFSATIFGWATSTGATAGWVTAGSTATSSSGGNETRPKNINVTYCVSTASIQAVTTASSGSGTTNYLPQWTSSTALGNSPIAVNGSNVGIGTTAPSSPLAVNGVIASLTGGVKYPDSSVQTTSAFLSSCPSGFSLIGTAGRRGSFCIDTTERAAQTWMNAKETCRTLNLTEGLASMCTLDEMYYACMAGVPTGMTGNWEWTTTTYSYGGLGAFLIGNPNCSSVGSQVLTSTAGFRCCLR